MQIAVSHPDRQHCHALLNALYKNRLLGHFYTTFAANKFPGFRDILGKRVTAELKKRDFTPIPRNLISHYPVLFLRSKFARYDKKQLIAQTYRQFDARVARSIATSGETLVIGYENANLATFKAGKTTGKTTVLDLAQIHHQKILELMPCFARDDEISFERNVVNPFKQEALEYSDYVITLSSFAYSSMIESGVAPHQVFKVSLGVDHQTFTPKPTYRSEPNIVFLFVGTLMRRKGLAVLLEAWEGLKLPRAKLVLVGPVGDGLDLLERYRSHIEYHPFLHHQELVRYYQQADVFLFPSFMDSWAQTVVEAMACGTPVVVTDRTGASDAVNKGGGYVVPSGDVTSLQEKILYFYEHPTEIERLGREAAEVAKEYTWEKYHQQILAIATVAFRK